MGRIDVLQEMGIIYTRTLLRGSTDGDLSTIRDFLNRAQDVSDVIVQVAGMDTRGIVVWSTTRIVTETIDLSDREHYRAIAIEGKESVIGRPVIGRVSGRRTIQFSRAVKRFGVLIGIVVVSVDVELAAKKYLPDTEGPSRPILSLIRSDGAPLGSTAGLERLPSLSAEILADTNLKEKVVGPMTFPDGSERLVALRPVAGGDAYVMVERPLELVPGDNAGHEISDLRLFFVVAAIAVAGLAIQTAFLLNIAALRATVRRERESAVNSLAQLDEIALNLPDLVIVGRVGNGELKSIDYASATAAQFVGVQPQALIANPSLLCPRASHGPQCRQALSELVWSGEFGPLEMEFQRADGSWLWVEINGRRVRGGDTGPGPVRAILVLRDISQRVEAREKVAQAARLIGDLLRLRRGWLAEFTVRLTPNGLRLAEAEHTEGITTMLGVNPEAVSGRQLGAMGLSRADLRQMLTQLRRAAMGSAVSFEQTLRNIETDHELVVEWHLCLVEQRDGIARIVGFTVDNTEAVTLRNELAHASKLAFLGEMAPSIAHELNQPLAAIALRAETLAQRIAPTSPDHAVVEQYVDTIIGLTQRAAEVIRNIRSFARRDMAPATEFNLCDSVHAALTVIDGRIAQSGVTVRLEAPPYPICVRGQEMQIEQTVMNLVANAIDAYETQEPPPTDREITIRLTIAGDTAILEVADHAGGIPDHIGSKIFRPFFTTKPAGKGSGLGLSMVERMIRAMGGTISCENRDGGAVFTVTLPTAQLAKAA